MIYETSTLAMMATGAAGLGEIFNFRHIGLLVVFFIINLLVYEFIVFGVGALAIWPFARQTSKIPEEICYNAMSCIIKLCIFAVFVLMVLWCSDVFRLIPVPH